MKAAQCELVYPANDTYCIMGAVVGGGHFASASQLIYLFSASASESSARAAKQATSTLAATLYMWVYEKRCVGGSRPVGERVYK